MQMTRRTLMYKPAVQMLYPSLGLVGFVPMAAVAFRFVAAVGAVYVCLLTGPYRHQSLSLLTL